jgi:hypothetical protein
MARDDDGERARSLDASGVEITTATVEIRVLRVGRRQLTAATFRQIPAARLLDPAELTLAGEVWGWVNYLCEPGERNFVYQAGGELCRWAFDPRDIDPDDRETWPSPSPFSRMRRELDEVSVSCVLARALRGERDLIPAEPEGAIRGRASFHFSRPFAGDWSIQAGAYGGMDPIDYKGLDAIRSAVAPEREVCGNPDPEAIARRREAGRRELRALLAGRGHGYDAEELIGRLDRLDEQMGDYADRYNERMEELREAPQLFIAT